MNSSDVSSIEAQPYRRFFLAGIVTALTVGASCGVWILWQIASAGHFTGAPLQQVNAHGHAQVMGWVGLFVMGFAYQMFPAIWQRRLIGPRLVPFVFATMVAGIVLQTVGIASAGASRAVPLSLAGGGLEIAAVATFIGQLGLTWRRSLSRHQPYLRFVGASLVFFLLQAIFGLWHTVRTLQAPTHDALIWTIATYQAVLRDLQIHGFALLMVLGVSIRVLPALYGVPQVTNRRAAVAWTLIVAGVAAEIGLFLAYRFTGRHVLAAVLLVAWLMLAGGALSITAVFRPWRPFPTTDRSAKFIRTAYLWLAVSMFMLLALPVERALVHVPFSHAYYGSIRHAVTVGFVSQMIIGIAARVVPDLCRRPLSSLTPLTGTFVLVNAGCFLRVTLQALTDVHPIFFRLVGVSGILELAALAAWGTHVISLMRASRSRVTPLPGPAARALPGSAG